ncbi:MAG: hypothetical protein ACI88L_000073 [Candidatus Paceibacteria bacterium]|jgi:hypothetical protein
MIKIINNTKSSISYIALIVSVAILFLPLSSVKATTLSTGMEASYVLGEPDFTSVMQVGGIADMIFPLATTYDATNDRLFALDFMGGPVRVLVYDLSAGITNGMPASYVIGQADFNAGATGTTAGTFNAFALDLEYDSGNDRLFVSDYYNHRVLVYNLSGGITNGMNASNVLGQANLTSGSEIFPVSTSTVGYPTGLAYDEGNDYLFVGNGAYARVMAFDLSGGITDNMDASWIIGQESATTTGGVLDQDGLLSPQYMDYDQVNDRLFVVSDVQNRVLVYDMSGGVSTGMDASYVIGQEDFTSDSDALDADSLISASAVTYDSTNDRLFVSDTGGNRVLSYDLASISNGMDASYVLGQTDFTSNSTSTTSSTFSAPYNVDYDSTNKYLFTTETGNSRVLIFDLSATVSSSSSTGRGYIHPPLCEATITPNTITAGEEATLSWNTNWPTENQNTYYSKVPGEGLYSSSVNSISIQPEHTTTYRLATFNLWGANFCEATVEVLDENGEELTSNNNSRLTAGVSNSPFARAIVSFFSKIFA